MESIKLSFSVFLRLCEVQDSIVPLVDSSVVKVIPVAFKKDEMALKPGMQVDSGQGEIVGTTEKIDHRCTKNNPCPDPEKLKDIFVKEAECVCLTLLDDNLSFPVGIYYISAKSDGKETCEVLLSSTKCIQTCLEHINSGVAVSNGVLQPQDKCKSACIDCIRENEVCDACRNKGQQFTDPSLRACNHCLDLGKKCIRLVALGLSIDSEIKNRGAQDLFEELNASDEIDNCLTLSDCIPDAVHVGKRTSCQFRNWFLIFQGCRINRIQLRTPRNDPNINGELKKHLTIAACRNRDRMDVGSMLEISDHTVRNIVSTGAPYITKTLIPEKYRLYEGNKKGVVSNLSGICLASPGTFLFTDSHEEKLYSAPLHYPVDVVEISSSL